MFNDIVDLDHSLIQQGYEDGLETSKTKSNEQARQLGLIKGKELGAELGMYRGIARALETRASKTPKLLANSKNQHLLEGFSRSCFAFPTREPLSPENHDVLINLRGQYRLLMARLSIQPQWPEEIERLHKQEDKDGNTTNTAESGKKTVVSMNVEEMF